LCNGHCMRCLSFFDLQLLITPLISFYFYYTLYNHLILYFNSSPVCYMCLGIDPLKIL
jgi:hypothetical protein